MGAGGKAIMFTSLPEYFRKLFIGSNIWQTMGFNAIIFIAALTAISPEYYEAATMDGASRFQKILYCWYPICRPALQGPLHRADLNTDADQNPFCSINSAGNPDTDGGTAGNSGSA